MKSKRMRTLKDQQMMSIPGSILVYFFGFVSLIPLFVMILGAFKNNIDIIKYPMSLSPFKNPTMKNIVSVIKETDMLLWFKNTLIVSGVTALTTVFMSLAAGYALAKIKFRGKGLLFALVMATMMMPKQMLLVPNYLVAKQLGLVNTMLGLILTSLAPAFGVFLSRQFISNLPTELFDSAEVDGAGRWRKMWHVTLPGIKSTIVILLIMNLGNILGSGFDRPFALQNNLVMDVAEVLSTFVYKNGILGLKFSLTTAIGFFQSIVCVFFLLLANWISRKMGERGIW